MSQLQTWLGRVAWCTVHARVTCARFAASRFLRRPWRRCRRYIVDSDARYSPSSASCGTSCFGERPAYRELVSTLMTCASSTAESALDGRWCGPHRPSSPSGCARQRSMVLVERPTTRQAGASRAPAVSGSSIAVRITSRSARPCRRPRPPHTGSPLFLRMRSAAASASAFLASELALQLADALARRRRRQTTLVESDAPALILGELTPSRSRYAVSSSPVSLEASPRRVPSARLSIRAQRASLVGLPDRQATCLVEPSRQILLPDACLSSQLRCTHGVLPGEPLDHLLLEGYGVRLGHHIVEFSPPRGSSSNDATATLAQGALAGVTHAPGAGLLRHLSTRSAPGERGL
jgi:hypothetical protein